jgi:formylglycine-generating enzyme required for sulfatase activity
MNKNKYALLVGVSEYEEEKGLKPLPSAVEDMAAMRRMLEQQGGFPPAQITCLPNPSKNELADAIHEFFRPRTSEDLALFFFSGHGIKQNKTGELYFAVPDTRKDQYGIVKHTAIAAGDLQEYMQNAASATQVLVLDCCFSGAFTKGYSNKDDNSIDIQAKLGGRGRAIFTSSNALEYSYSKEGDLSVYTKFFVEGVESGLADRDKDGKISVDELHTYIFDKVKQYSPSMTPQFFLEEKGHKIILADSPIQSEAERCKLKYREKVEKFVNRGSFQLLKNRFNPAVECCLSELRAELKLSVEISEAIEAEVLQPTRKHQGNLVKYEQVLRETIQKEKYPFSESLKMDLQDCAKALGLSVEESGAIEQIILPIIDRDEEPRRLSQDNSPTECASDKPGSGLSHDPCPIPVESDKLASEKDTVAHQSFTFYINNDISLEMIAIPGGDFWRGSPDGVGAENERPRQKVTISPFWISKYLITQAQYRAIVGSNPSHFLGDEHPVECVSWWEAVTFCERLTGRSDRQFRLPSESEWEYACRAETETPFFFGDSISTKQVSHRLRHRGTTEVGMFPPNSYVLYDMHGNVWEWCEDHWNATYEGAPIDGKPWLTGDQKAPRLLRGGAWNTVSNSCRSAHRYHQKPDVQNLDIGIRIVCS